MTYTHLEARRIHDVCNNTRTGDRLVICMQSGGHIYGTAQTYTSRDKTVLLEHALRDYITIREADGTLSDSITYISVTPAPETGRNPMLRLVRGWGEEA